MRAAISRTCNDASLARRAALAVTAGALGVWAGVVILVAGAVAVLW